MSSASILGSHADAEQPLKARFAETKQASWGNPNEIKSRYRSANILRNQRVVFNIVGNKYRLVVRINYKTQIVFVRTVEVLAILVEKYEETHFPIESPDPVEAIKFRMDQSGFTTADLAKILGGRNRVSEVLNGKRRLTLGNVKKLSSKWKIPAESLL